MPLIIPTPAELEQMSWYARQRAAKRARDEFIRPRQVEEPLRPRNAPKRNRISEGIEEWAEDVRREARLLLECLPADPDARAHRVEAMR